MGRERSRAGARRSNSQGGSGQGSGSGGPMAGQHSPFGSVCGQGTWGDGSELLAVPNYARENRAAHLRRHIVRSMVWMKDQ